MKKLGLMVLAVLMTVVLSGCCAYLTFKGGEMSSDFSSQEIIIDETIVLEAESEENKEPEKIESAQYTITREDRSYRNNKNEVLIEHYYELVTIKGDNPNFEKINGDLKQKMNDFFFSEEDFEDYKSDPYITSEYPYYNVCSAKVTYNFNGFICVKMSTSWMMGGVGNYNNYAYTYNLNTGELATLQELTGIEPLALEGQLEAKTWNYLVNNSDTFDDAYDTLLEFTLDEFNFSVENGQIVLLFPTYTFGPGAAGSTEVPTGIYIKGN